MNAANTHADATPTAAPTPLTNAAPACIIFLVGRGGGGKTHLLRYLVERVFATGGSIVIADGDRTNRTLPLYFEDVQAPPGSDDRVTRQWLEQVIERMITGRFSVVVDLGGGDMVLKQLALELDLLAMLEQHAVRVVVLHLIGPEVESLGSLAAMEAKGPLSTPLFAPERTALILNEGLIGDGLDAGEVFAPVREHKLFRAALQRRAEVVLMPRLRPALEVNRRHLSFAAAATGQTKAGMPPLGITDRQRVTMWLRAMDQAFAPIMAWLP